ncbi:hypothetical protein AB670_02576 [Chryseobacterium sp. MOF25P]|uniref:hypothetical protein n=1 Tax=unclassified Chryseobacterium TaxID=2593645 RepID=UPI00080569A7|nr:MULTISPECIES: hypothetical protein [unclassified Chryseobacterium]OBW41125.1 hypothetical protein AB670_02576 [Chryseobacterium sp. MOF25P]OBW45745.1 hypothetical protein AB671_02153 [Chryseobacterium sp. BGARF1]
MAIRFKDVEVCNAWQPTSQGGHECSEYIYVQVPIGDWNATPMQIVAPSWTVGAANPVPISLQIIFPELEFIYSGFTNFRYKIKKTVNGVDFINITGAGLTGDVFDDFNIRNKTVQINFQNMGNLSVGIHTINLIIEAYSVETDGTETFKEDSSIQNIIIPIKITVLSGNGFNTDSNVYQLTYNKADDSLSGDSKITVYSAEAVMANVTDPFIELIQTSGATEKYLTFQNNATIQGKPVGNYSGNVTITKGTQSKTVKVNLEVINDSTQFYLNPTAFNISLQKNLSEAKTVTAIISNLNNLNISAYFFPSFIESVTILNNEVTILTKNSSNLILGNYSGDIILKSGNVQKVISVNLTVLQGIKHDFSGASYYFALDKNKVVVNKTNVESAYVKMTLSMYFKGFGSEYQENQTYTYPFFKGSAEIYPGEEIQDFFIKAKNPLAAQNPNYQYDLALVSVTFQEMSATDSIVTAYTLDNLRFAPGKKPKCFPFFTDYSVRKTFSDSLIKLSHDSLSEKTESKILYDQYLLPKPIFTPKFTIDQYVFNRKEFKAVYEKNIVSNNILQFLPFPNPQNVVHIEWENQNLVFDWFTAVETIRETSEIESITGESKYYKEEKFDSSYSKLLTVNSGWILEEEIDLITDLLMSRLCFVTIREKTYKAFPIGKKNELFDTDNNSYSMDLEFKILIEK